MLYSKVAELLKIEHPIIEGGMVWAGGEVLAAAVSEAGGLGTIAGGSCKNGQELEEKINYVRNNTEKPFAVNIPMIYPQVNELIEVILKNNVRVVITSAGDPKKYTSILKEAGITVIHVVGNKKFALKAEAAGVDMIVVEGVEAGGHNGKDELTLFTMLPNIVNSVSIPVIAAGGIAKGEQILAAIFLGAEAVQIGTLFASSKESSAHINYKNAIVNSNDTSTILTGRRFAPVRSLKNNFSEKVLSWEYSDLSNKEIINKIGHGGSYKGIIEGDIENGVPLMGQSSVLIDEILSVKDIFEKLLSEMYSVIKKIHR